MLRHVLASTYQEWEKGGMAMRINGLLSGPPSLYFDSKHKPGTISLIWVTLIDSHITQCTYHVSASKCIFY